MKKYLTLFLALCMVFALCACGGPKTAEYTLGMGIMINTNSSKENHAQVDATLAAVVLDTEGKIVSCRLDCVQNKMDLEDGVVDTGATFKTKMELGDDYNMVKYSDAIAEWYDQAKAFETFVTGKTIAEVKAIPTKTNDEGYQVSADETLSAGCTIQITDFIGAVEKAGNDKWAQKFSSDGNFKLGVAAKSTANESVNATEDEPAQVKMYSEYAASVVGADGKILCCLNDATQPVVKIAKDGAFVESDASKGTKRELGENYNMVKYGNSIAEWDAQSDAFSKYCIGKTADEVLAIETKQNDEGYQVSTDETLLASCTISIQGMMAVIAQAANNAR